MTIKFGKEVKRSDKNAETKGVGNIKGRKLTTQKAKAIAPSKAKVKKK
jgi:hypothetical protein